MYSSHLGDQYTSLGAQTLGPKKHFPSFVFPIVIQQKICRSSDQQLHSASNYFKMA